MAGSGGLAGEGIPWIVTTTAGLRLDLPTMQDIERRNSAARWYEATAWPGAVLLVVVAALYVPSIWDGFILDDYRALRVMREYREGLRAAPDVYRFLTGEPERNRAEREAGWYPWWMADELKYQHMRPLAEWMLYGEYLVLGERPIGYRLVSLGLYGVGVVLVLGLMRMVCGDERVARWAALVFAVAASHAIPVMFVSSQGDVAALVCALGAALSVGGFVRAGGAGRLVVFAICLAAGLGLKEAMLPVAAAPAMFWFVWRGEGGAGKRAMAATGLSALLAVGWLGMYVSGGFGSNTSIMLDPLRDFSGYVAAAPVRALLLLAAWLIPMNPFLFDCKAGFKEYEWVYVVVGAAVLAPVVVMLWRRHRRAAGAGFMAVWAMMFLPILVCTPADDRVMMLPSIGLAYFAAIWMTYPRGDGSRRLRVVPVLLFILIQATTVVGAGRLLAFLESESRRHLGIMTAEVEKMPEARHVFVVNNPFAFEGLFMKDRLRFMPGMENVSVSLLSDVAAPRVAWVGDSGIRLEAGGQRLLSSFLGRMGAVRGRMRAIGETLRGEGFEARVVEADESGVRVVEFRFDEPVRAAGARFYSVDENANPTLIVPQ